jgi:hypothetical protein
MAYIGYNQVDQNKKYYGDNKPVNEFKYPIVQKDSLGFYVTIKEHYGAATKDSGTILMQNDIEYCLVRKEGPARIIPKSRWSCSIDNKLE